MRCIKYREICNDIDCKNRRLIYQSRNTMHNLEMSTSCALRRVNILSLLQVISGATALEKFERELLENTRRHVSQCCMGHQFFRPAPFYFRKKIPRLPVIYFFTSPVPSVTCKEICFHPRPTRENLRGARTAPRSTREKLF